MKRTKLLFIFCLLLAGLTACGPKDTAENPSTPPDQSQSTTDSQTTGDSQSTPSTSQPTEIPEDPNAIDFFDCGVLDLPNSGETTGRENFEEFLNVTGVGKSATIQIKQSTTEGDPIVSTLSYTPRRTHPPADKFAAESDRGVKETSWKRLVITETTQNDTLYQVFRLTNLDEGAVTGETPDGDDVCTLFQESLED